MDADNFQNSSKIYLFSQAYEQWHATYTASASQANSKTLRCFTNMSIIIIISSSSSIAST